MSATATSRSASWEWPAAVLLALLAAALYAPTLRNGYVFDDGVIVRDNPIVKELRYGEAVSRPYWPAPPGVDRGTANWRPLATLSFVIECQLRGGGDPFVHHATNALLYGLVVLALFPLARRLAGRGWPALVACALFATHPAHTEAVAPIVGRTDLLAALGALLALECFARYRAESPHWGWLALGALAYAFGLAGKESAAPVLLLLPAADWLLGGRRLRELVGKPALAYLPFVAVAVAYVFARMAVLGDATFRHADAVEYSFVERLLFAARNAVVSLDLLAAPTRFHHVVTTLPENAPFTYPDPTGAGAVAYALGGLFLGLGWLGLVRRAPRAAFLWLAAVITWLPTSGLIPAAAGASLRFLFLPSAFLCCALALAFAQVHRFRPGLAPVLAVIVGIVVLAGGFLTVRRTLQWRSDGTFYAAVIDEVPDCYTAHYSLGTWYATRRKPDLQKARECYVESIRITGDSPYSFEPRLNLAISYELGTSGRRYGPGAKLDEAARIYRELTAFAPERSEPHLNLALILDRQGRPRQARVHYERTLDLRPDHPQRRRNRASPERSQTLKLDRHIGRRFRSDFRSPAAIEYGRLRDRGLHSTIHRLGATSESGMGYPRARLVDATRPGYYHCISRCVRRAFLCGDQYDHRRQWLEDRLAELLDVFAIDACGYAVMSNHLHLILKTNPDAARHWSPLEVAQRWVRLFPRGLQRAKQAATNSRAKARIEQDYLNGLAARKDWVGRWRDRFASLSWFHKLLKEPIAKRANREDDCTGHFWEGRFKSIRLLDPAAILACMVYVDLNPLRAKMVQTLHDCAFTSLLQRLKVLRRKGQGTRRSGAIRPAKTRVPLLAIDMLFRMTTGEYVSLVASAGGVAIDQRDHRPTLGSLGIDPDQWARSIQTTIRWFGTAIGSTAALLNEATRRKTRHVVNPLKIYRE